MSASRNLARRAVQHVCDRLEQLHEALLGLGQRLRDSIAQLVGSHIGDAVREAVRTLLEAASPRPPGADPPAMPFRSDSYRGRPYHDDFHDDPYRRDASREGPYRDDLYADEPYRRDFHDDRDRDLPERNHRFTPPAPLPGC